MTTSPYQSVGAVDAVEWACVLCGHHSQNAERVEQQICIRFCIKLEHSSMETIQMIQKAAAMGNWWLAASSQQCARSTCLLMHHVSCRVFLAKHQITQVTQPLYSPRFDALWLLVFPKTKITFKGEKISDRWDSGKYNRAADGDWENCVRSQGACYEGNHGVIVLCTIFLVSCIFLN